MSDLERTGGRMSQDHDDLAPLPLPRHPHAGTWDSNTVGGVSDSLDRWHKRNILSLGKPVPPPN